MTLLDDVDRRRERAARDVENSARLAHAYATFYSQGQGTIQHPKRVKFGVTFIEKPYVGYANVVDVNELADELGVEDTDDVPLPICTGYVIEWDQDDRDFYTGCWIAARVHFADADAVPEDATPEIEHHFTFQAIAMKDVPTDSRDATD